MSIVEKKSPIWNQGDGQRKNAPDANLAYNYKMLVERADNRLEELGKRVNDSAAHVDDQPQFREERTWKVAREVGSG